MTDKFIVTGGMGIKQVGFNGAMGVKVLSVDQIVDILNGFNNNSIKLEERIAGQLNMLEVAGKEIESLEGGT
jgi:hypothetical protein